MELHYTRPNHLARLHDELLAAGITLERVEGDGDDIWITVTDGVSEASVAAVVGAHDPAKYDAAAAAVVQLRGTLETALDGRLATLPGKRFGQLTDQELLYLVLCVVFGQTRDTGIFDAQGIVQPLEDWKV
jgi:hypothetical protein